MHSTDLKHQFVTLRARGLALSKIAEQLNVPKSALGRWQAECEEDIQQLQRIEWEEIEEQYGYTLQDDLKRIMKRLRAAEDQLDARTSNASAGANSSSSSARAVVSTKR